jgi:hypothetical protein
MKSKWKYEKVLMRSPYFQKHILLLFLFIIIILGATDFAESAPPLRIAGNPPNGTQYQPYTATLTGNDGTTPYTWTLTAGSLPPGLTLVPSPSPSLTAAISGTPTQIGTYSFTITLRDSSNPVGSDALATSIKITSGVCSFVGSFAGGITFNSIDPSLSPGPLLGTVTQQIPFTCNAGAAYTVTANPASGWTMVSGANTIPYTLGLAASGTGLGATPIDLLTTTSRIIQADYANAPAGLYANSQPITLTVSWVAAGGGSIVASIPAGSVNGTVITTCAVSQTPGTLTFAIDPSVSGMTSATITPDMLIKCTNGDSVVITASSTCGGAAPQLDSAYPACGGAQIPYTFTFVSSATGLGFGTAIPLNIGGSANSANYQNAPVGNYGDLQTLTITY